MSNIYTGIDVGTDSVKIVVVEKIKNSFNLLASSCTPSTYINHGEVTNVRALANVIRDGINEVEDMLGLKIDKAIINVPMYDSEYMINEADVTITNSEKIVTDVNYQGSKAVIHLVGDELPKCELIEPSLEDAYFYLCKE